MESVGGIRTRGDGFEVFVQDVIAAITTPPSSTRAAGESAARATARSSWPSNGWSGSSAGYGCDPPPFAGLGCEER